jgi:hypothetical protein
VKTKLCATYRMSLLCATQQLPGGPSREAGQSPRSRLNQICADDLSDYEVSLPAVTPARARQSPPVIQVNNRLIYYSMRADRGNDISKENPNFVAGAAGGRG